jgi:hypothetical protein
MPLVVLGVVAWVVALYFGCWGTVKTTAPKTPTPAVGSGQTVDVEQPNVAAAGAACGFGIGGGLCFLGAALAASRFGGGAAPNPSPQPPADIPAVSQGIQSASGRGG